jgi:hypothetical protein
MSAFSAEDEFVPRPPVYPLRADSLTNPSFGRLVAISGRIRCGTITNTNALSDSPDRAALAGRVAALEYDNSSVAMLDHPVLQLDELCL